MGRRAEICYKAARKSLEALAAASEPVSIRVSMEALLRVRGAKSRYKRIESYIIHCHTPAAIAHVPEALRNLIHSWAGARLVDEQGNPVSFRSAPVRE